MRENILRTELENGIATEILHVSRRLIQRGTRAMETLNIGVGQLPILQLLNENGTMTQRQIAEKIRVTPATICGTIKRMEKAGLIARTAAVEDGRVSCVSLTEEGVVRCRQAMAVIDLPYGEMLAGFSEEECRTLQEFVKRMGENLSRAVDTSEEESK